MIKIFPSHKVKDFVQYTIINEPISSYDLVDRGAVLFVREFTRRYTKQTRVVVFAGQGNNGADALSIAYLLLEEGYRVETVLFNPTGYLSDDCEKNKQQLMRIDKVEFTEVTADFIPPELTSRDVVIDGLFGCGLETPLTGGYAGVVNYLNSSNSTIVSIDIPSGLFGEDNRTNNPQAIIRANLTLTYQFPKLAFLLKENYPYVGEWKVLDVGLSSDMIHATACPYALVTEMDIISVLSKRDKFAHKGTYGHGLLIAGSRGMMGAALLTAEASMRSGLGRLTVHVPQRGEQILQIGLPEAMLSFDPHKEYFTVLPEIGTYSAIGIGPGLGRHLESATAFGRLLQTAKRPLVIDADAINFLASNFELIDQIPERSILTPHVKEFERLVGSCNTDFERLLKAQSFAAEHRITIVLKGAHTAVCTAEGNVYFNSTGNPGMATAGSGDVLTGIILGLLAQGYEPETAAVSAVYMHGLAGDMAKIYRSEESMIARDIIDKLGSAFKQSHNF